MSVSVATVIIGAVFVGGEKRSAAADRTAGLPVSTSVPTVTRSLKASAYQSHRTLFLKNMEKADWHNVSLECYPNRSYTGRFRTSLQLVRAGETAQIPFESWNPPIPLINVMNEGRVYLTIQFAPRLTGYAEVVVFTSHPEKKRSSKKSWDEITASGLSQPAALQLRNTAPPLQSR